MTMPLLLCEQLRDTREWTQMLVADLKGDDWLFQPSPGMAHALWLCGHLAAAQETLLFNRCLDQEVLDASFRAHFPIGAPILSAEEYDWPTPEVVLQHLAEQQSAAEKAILKIDESILNDRAYGKDGTTHPHYKTKAGAISHMIRHEAFHAGQLATLRRLLGKNFLR